MNTLQSDDDLDGIEQRTHSWYPRTILRRTNWFYHLDSLRHNDLLYLDILWDIFVFMREYALQFYCGLQCWPIMPSMLRQISWVLVQQRFFVLIYHLHNSLCLKIIAIYSTTPILLITFYQKVFPVILKDVVFLIYNANILTTYNRMKQEKWLVSPRTSYMCYFFI